MLRSSVQILEATNHEEIKELLPKMIAESGPIDAFIIRMGTPPYEPFDEDLLSPLVPHCKIITSASAGFNEFPVDWLTSKGIWFCNTVDAVAEATADMAVFLILAVLRDTYRGERGARDGTWKKGLVPSRDPTGLTLGIVGMGAIGKVSHLHDDTFSGGRVTLTRYTQYIAKKAVAFNLEIHYHNRHRLPPDIEKQYNATYHSTLHSLLSASDVVSISVPLNPQTTNLISTSEFAAMKDGSFFVNTARGAIVDEPALIQALESGKVTRAGLDVMVNEPNIKEYLKRSDKVVLQPHTGGLTDVAFMKSERECFENIKALWKTGRPNAPVNDLSGRA